MTIQITLVSCFPVAMQVFLVSNAFHSETKSVYVHHPREFASPQDILSKKPIKRIIDHNLTHNATRTHRHTLTVLGCYSQT